MKKRKNIALLALIPLVSLLCSCELDSLLGQFTSSESEVTSSVESTSSELSSSESESETVSESTSSTTSVGPFNGYYDSIDETSGATKMLEDIQTLMFNSHKHYTTYGQIRSLFFYSDADPDKPGNILSFYSHTSMDGTWDGGTTYNREHVWPLASSGGLFQRGNDDSGGGGDLHHIRPAAVSENSDRGNQKFGSFIPPDHAKGDCARICMYLYAHYSNRINGSGTNRSSYVGALNLGNVFTTNTVLKQWNELDPVDDLERARNEYCYSLQGNRNPFIDHPEWVNMVI